MARIRKAVMTKITAEYKPLNEAFRHGSRIAFWYGAQIALVISVGHQSWALPVNKKRAGRSLDDALKAILRETKVGAKIIKRATRLLAVEDQSSNKRTTA